MTVSALYRRRLIPEECVRLKDDVILLNEPSLLVTSWKALKPRPDLSHGFSCYYLDEGYKISRFYDADNTLLYHYCDIISPAYEPDTASLIVTDLLADVIIYPDGFVKVVDLAEMADALEAGVLDIPMLRAALRSLNRLLQSVYAGKLPELSRPMERFDSGFTFT
ncbi:MAG TPA: DUF402 domain-containing protein [Candidatus Eisenbergiella merdipullorum]|uniref:DUF402 domain-containing protein n=1 Tax=Candidatus Eisenbergiella merdipullorum TaxID=2838553 RepID=A0A9D2KZF1_9FIRM|nr:DUF402 domain-containing protein [Candidatus Eisenbergiella merdipullorum]